MIRITDKYKCCGCSACMQICPQGAITMVKDGEGFLYPKIDEITCIQCGLCEKICPIISNENEHYNKATAYAYKNYDENIRLESSSGGAFSAIATAVLKAGGVVFGATFNEYFEVEHHYIQDVSELKCFRGSKYVQSVIGDSYKQVEVF